MLPSILVVDDHYPNHLAVASALKKLPIQITKVFSGAEALNLASERLFSVILLDVKMPVMNGYETAVELQKLPGYMSIPIIFMTAADSDEMNTLENYSIYNAQFIYKPFDSDSLIQKIQLLIN